MEIYEKMIKQLKSGEVTSIEVKKEEFLVFREFLVKDEKFKHFRGVAKQGGNIEYTYLENPRS